MRFVCDSCRAQYMISDDKVGAKGVKVRCKKCGYVILVRKAQSAAHAAPPAPPPQALGDPGDAMATQVMDNPLHLPQPGQNYQPDIDAPPTQVGAGGPNGNKASGVLAAVPDDEISNVFDQVLNSSATKIPEGALAGKGEALGDSTDDRMSTRVLDADMVKKLADESAGGEGKNGAGKNGDAGPQHDWFVAVDEKQVGPLNVDKIKSMWDRGEIGPDSLCWRAGFSDWTALSEVADLASVLAPKPQKPVIVAPASVGVPSVMTVPVESAFSAGGVTRTVRSEVPMMAAAPGEQAEPGGWKPSAASALQSLVKEELSIAKPAAKSAPQDSMIDDHRGAKGGLGGLLDSVPEATPVRGNGRLQTDFGHAAGGPPVLAPSSYAPPPYQAQYPQYRPEGDSKKMLLIGGIIGGVLLLVLVGLVGYLAARKNGDTGPTPVATVKPDVPMPPPPAGMKPVTPPAPVVAPPAPTTPNPVTPPPTVARNDTTPRGTVEHRAPVEHQVREPREPREPKQVKDPTGTETPMPAKRAAVEEPKSGSDREFEDAFGPTKKDKKRAAPSDDGDSEAPKKKAGSGSVYIPPAPGAGGDVPDQLGQSEIMQTVLAHKADIVACVKKQKAQDSDSSGTLVMRWTINPNGHTSGVTAVTEDFKGTPLAGCLKSLISGWVFPRHKQPQDPIPFPFKF